VKAGESVGPFLKFRVSIQRGRVVVGDVEDCLVAGVGPESFLPLSYLVFDHPDAVIKDLGPHGIRLLVAYEA